MASKGGEPVYKITIDKITKEKVETKEYQKIGVDEGGKDEYGYVYERKKTR